MNEKLEKILTRSFYMNESLLKAELYHQCKLKNIEIHLEQQIKNCGRPDAILIIKDNIIIIECKNNAHLATYNIYNSQIEKYNHIGLPIVILGLIESIDDLFLLLEKEQIHNCVYLYDKTKNKFIPFHLKEVNKENEKKFKILMIHNKFDLY